MPKPCCHLWKRKTWFSGMLITADMQQRHRQAPCQYFNLIYLISSKFQKWQLTGLTGLFRCPVSFVLMGAFRPSWSSCVSVSPCLCVFTCFHVSSGLHQGAPPPLLLSVPTPFSRPVSTAASFHSHFPSFHIKPLSSPFFCSCGATLSPLI